MMNIESCDPLAFNFLICDRDLSTDILILFFYYEENKSGRVLINRNGTLVSITRKS